MITNFRNKLPKFTFGLGKLELTISLGQTVRVYQNTIYNNSEYELFAEGATRAIYGFDITPTTTGVMEISGIMTNKVAKRDLPTNKIYLTTLLTSDSSFVKTDTTLITVDNG